MLLDPGGRAVPLTGPLTGVIIRESVMNQQSKQSRNEQARCSRQAAGREKRCILVEASREVHNGLVVRGN